jgi:hypothetical protein
LKGDYFRERNEKDSHHYHPGFWTCGETEPDKLAKTLNQGVSFVGYFTFVAHRSATATT